MKHVSISLEGTAGCCGVLQLVDFSNVEDKMPWSGSLFAEGATEAAAYTNLFNKLREYEFTEHEDEDGYYHDDACAVVQIWFVKRHDYNSKDNETYDAEALRLLVETIPGVLCLGEFRNPNTKNLIKGYQWAV